MSIKAVNAVLSSRSTNGNARCVLIALADYADDDGVCWPSVANVAKKANVCERTARAAIRNLERTGEIEAAMNAGPRGTNRYVITCVAGGGKSCRGASPAGGQTVAPEQPSSSFTNVQEDTGTAQAPETTTTPLAFVADLPEVAAKARKPRATKAKPKPPPDPRVKELLAEFEGWQGYPIANWAAEGAAAKKIINAGYTIAETRTVWRALKFGEFWHDKHLALASVFTQMGAKLGKVGRRTEAIELEPVRRGGAE